MRRALLTLPGLLCLIGVLLSLSSLGPREWRQSGKSGSVPKLNYEIPNSVEKSARKERHSNDSDI